MTSADDGPHPCYTEQLLDGLKERGVVATFFVTGEHTEIHPEVIERMKEEGHLIGNHTYSHIQLTKNNREVFKEELIKTNEILKEITGEEVQYVRPPYGSWDTILDKEDDTCKVFYQFMEFVNNMLWFSSTEGNWYMGFSNIGGNLFEALARKDGAVEKLQVFLQDLGIHYQLLIKDNGEGKSVYCRMGEREVLLSALISSGTRSLIFFFFWYLQMEKCSFIYVDEFDAFYHTDLARAVVRKIIEIPGVQAVITSHNTDLMSNDLLRPDCIFKLEDNRIRPFSELTDKALREAHNLQKMYKAGAF